MKRFILFHLILTGILPLAATAQNFDFNILPLALNPAFTGLFDGNLRVSPLYKDQWSASKVSFNAYGASVDLRCPVKPKGYFAAGAAFLEGQAADQSIRNFSSVVSGAYHRRIMKNDKGIRRAEVALGIQAGYIQRNIDLSGNEYRFLPYVYHIGDGAKYLVANVGISFSHIVNQKLSYTIGLAGNNLDLMDDGTVTIQNPLLKVTPSGAAIAAANWSISDRWTMRPAFLHIISKDFYAAGNEFRFTTQVQSPSIIFLGIWYRTGHIITANVGYEFSYFRLAAGYDYYSSLGLSSRNGGLQFLARYILPTPKRG